MDLRKNVGELRTDLLGLHTIAEKLHTTVEGPRKIDCIEEQVDCTAQLEHCTKEPEDCTVELRGCKKKLELLYTQEQQDCKTVKLELNKFEGQVASTGEKEDCMQVQEDCMQGDCMKEDCMQEDCMKEDCIQKLGNYRQELLGLRIEGMLESYRRKERMAGQNRIPDRNTADLVANRKPKQLLGYHSRPLHQECELGLHRHVRDRVHDRVRGHGAHDAHAHRLQTKLRS